MAAQDFLQDDNDFKFANGDLVIGDSEADHIEDIIGSAPGEWKEFPLVGVNINQYIGSAGKESEISRQVKLQLTGDGYSQLTVNTSRDPDGLFNISVDGTRDT